MAVTHKMMSAAILTGDKNLPTVSKILAGYIAKVVAITKKKTE